MIDPYNITKYNRTDWELEEFALFCILVTGKRADYIAKQLYKMLYGVIYGSIKTY